MDSQVSENQIRRWNQEGFLYLPKVLCAKRLAELRLWIDEIAQWATAPNTQAELRGIHDFEDTGTDIRLTRSEYLIDFHSGLKAFLTKEEVPNIAAQLVGEPIALYKEKINYKYPGGGGYAAHQDAPAFPHISYSVTCAVAIDDANLENGCLFVAPGRHLEGLLKPNAVACIDDDLANDMPWKPVEMQAGDVLFFDSHLPHKSPPNRSNRPRKNLYLTYNKLSEGDLRAQYYQDKLQSRSKRIKEGKAQNKISLIGHFQGKIVST